MSILDVMMKNVRIEWFVNRWRIGDETEQEEVSVVTDQCEWMDGN